MQRQPKLLWTTFKIVVPKALVLCAIPLVALAIDLRSKFDQISTGLTREAVIALMGTAPTSTQETTTLGVTATKLRWDESVLGLVYQITFIFDRVIEKRVCDRRNEC